MTAPQVGGVAVTQADRDAAAGFIRRNHFNPDWANEVERGECDSHDVVQSYAAHRLAATPTPLPALTDTVGALVEALKVADAAITEMFRYFDGGETRGSYDGKPERDQLRKAGYKTRAAIQLATGGQQS